MSRNWFAVLALALALCASLSSLAQAPPSADAYVTSLQPAANFGSSPLLPVQSGTSSYVRLNLSALPANATVAKATLRLYVNAVAAPGWFDIYRVDQAWSEKGLSFNTAPPLASSVTAGHPVFVSASSLNQFVLVDITPVVEGWLDGSIPNHGVALALTSPSGSFSFDSKESTGTGHQPELEVIFGSSAATPAASLETSVVATAAGKGVSPGPDPYIDNGTAQQVGANFNIDGSGTAASFNAISQYSLNGVPALGTSGTASLFLGPGAGSANSGTQNTFLGVSAGQSNSSGSFNTFTGANAGLNNTTGSYGTFVGMQAGFSNTSGASNSFLGVNSGYSNTTGTNNTFLGHSAGFSNTTGTVNTFVGDQAGFSNTTGLYSTFVGMQAGANNTWGQSNTFIGVNSGYGNTTGLANTFVGVNAGLSVLTGSHNTYVGFNAGMSADPAANNNIYISQQGVTGDSGTIRIGDPSNQNTTYIAGITGSATDSGVPVFVDSTGKLGTGGGTVNFSQVVGTVSSPQFSGTYGNSVTLSNTTDFFTGTFTGNGAGLTGVSSGSSWPIVPISADYAVQTTDFSTPTKYGNFLILSGKVSHTFTLPNPPPANGSCVAIGNVADGGINSGTNVFLTVNPNGLNVDASVTVPTQPRRMALLYCSDGTGYYRLGYSQNGVSEIGPWLYTVDTGTVNALQTTFRNGMDLGLHPGNMIFLLPINANTSPNPTLNVNGLGANRILKYGNRGLAPGDLSTAALALLIYDGQFWQLINPQTTIPTIVGTTGSIGGGPLTAGSCTSGSVGITGVTVGHPVSVSASDGSLPNGLIILSAAVTGPNTVTVQLCATASVTPAAKTYNFSTQ